MGDEGKGHDSSATLYVGHSLPESITKDHILQHFKDFVPHINVLGSRVFTNKAGKRHCKLVFTNDVAADQAISQMNGTAIRGFKLHVNRWGPKKKESEIDPLIQFLESTTPQRGNADDDSSDDSQSDISSVSIGSSLVCETEGSFRAYVGSNLPVKIQESTLKDHFQSFGYAVKSVRAITTRKKQSRFAIVTLSSQEELDKAIKQVHGTKLLGYRLTVSPKIKQKGSPHKQGQQQHSKERGKKPSAVGNQPTDPCTVILRGIPPTVDDSLLRPMCEAYGKVIRLDVNRNEGTAVVSYPSPELAASASTGLNGLKCGGGTLSVVSSASREPLYPGCTAPGPPLASEATPSSTGPHHPRYRMPHQPFADAYHGSDPPLQERGPHSQDCRSQLHGHRPPMQNYGPPPQGLGPPLHDHGYPGQFQELQLGYEPPQQGHRLPQQGHGPPHPGRGPPQRGHGPPQPGYGPPQQGYGPPQQGYGHPQPGYRPPQQGYGPPQPGYGPPQLGYGPPLPGHGHPGQVHGRPPQSYGTSAQVQKVSVKISNIHSSVSVEKLKQILSVVPSAELLFHATPGSKPNYAHVNCADQADVSRVMEILKGKKFNGMPVSVKIQERKEFSVPPSPTVLEALPVDMQGAVSVKVSRLPKSVTEKQIRRHINSIQGVSSVVLKSVHSQEHDYAYVNCESGFAAGQVVQKLNEMQMSGSTIKATIQPFKKAKGNDDVAVSEADTAEEGQEMSQDLYDFFQNRFHKDIDDFEANGGTLHYSEGFISVRGPEAEVNAFYKNSIKPVKDGSQPLTADQWGQLMAAKEGGTTLFQELSSPFLHNPNVKLERRENPFTLVIVGFQEAVDAARSHFFSKMDTKMVVDR